MVTGFRGRPPAHVRLIKDEKGLRQIESISIGSSLNNHSVVPEFDRRSLGDPTGKSSDAGQNMIPYTLTLIGSSNQSQTEQ